MSDNTIYFANKPANERASILTRKTEMWFQSMEASGYLSKLRTMYAAYHGAYFTDSGDSHTISFSGEQGELVQIAVNHLHNMCQIMLNMITATRPAMQARSVNTDYKSLVQTKLANGLLDYYMREKRLEQFLRTACEYAIVLGSGYIKLEWNATAGEIYDYNEELGVEIREGDLEFSVLSPFNVYFDSNREDSNHDWMVVRDYKSRHDLIAKYPEYADKIAALPSKNELNKFASFSFHQDETDLVPVFEFYHRRSEAVPDGLYHLYLSSEITLLESPLPYRSIPIYSISSGKYLGTPFGYTPMFDLIGIQDAVNSLYSTILTNQTAFGVQNILVPQGANVSMSELSGNLNVIEYNQQLGEIRPLNLTQTPREVFEFIGMLEKAMETISGINSVSRGNPDSNLRSGNALALVQSMTLQYVSGLQQSYANLIEDLGTGIINALKDHASVPRVAAIVGKNNRSYLEEFTGDSLSSINRVVVDISNPLAKTTAGKVEMASQLLQMGAVKTPEQYFSVINTGQLDVMTEDTQAQLFLVKAENERLVKNQMVAAIFTDEHALHIKEHATVLADPELRFDPELFKRVADHIQEHVDLLRSTDPNVLGILGQQPLAPPGGSPIAPQQSEPMPNAPNLSPPGGPLAATQLQQTGAAPANLPNIPLPPEETQINPELLMQQYAVLTGQNNGV